MSDKENRIPGLILGEEYSNVRKELNQIIKNVIIILELEGFNQPFALNLTHNENIRNLIIASIDNEALQEMAGN